MQFLINNKVHLYGAPGNFIATVKKRLTFPNPKWIENEKRGYSNSNTPQEVKCYEQGFDSLVIPRGYVRHLIKLARSQGIQYNLQDARRRLPEVGFSFHGNLKPFQKQAVQDVLSHEFGTLSAPTGGGKTVMALYVIAQRKQPTLIVVHTKELLKQWINQAETFLKIPAKEIGAIGGGRYDIGKQITVATVQSLYKCAESVKDRVGFLIVDECHRAPSRTFSEAVTAFDSRYMLGLSATPWRRDKLSRLIYWTLGDVVHTVDKANLLKTKDILHVEVITRQTDFRTLLDSTAEYSKMLSALTQDTQRNELICSDVAEEAGKGEGICLVLSDRKAHCDTMAALLRSEHGVDAEVLTGGTPKKQRETIVDKLNGGEVQVLIATGQLIGEGFDCKQLTKLFLTTPIKFNGRLLQYLGRVLRPAPGKERAIVYDYVDQYVGVLKASAKSRQRVYLQAA